MNGVTLRQITVADSRALTEFLARALDDERDYFDATPLHIINQSLVSGDIWLVVESGETLVGCVCIALYDDRTGRVSQLAVAVEHRGKGIGSNLMKVAEQIIKNEKAVRRSSLACSTSSPSHCVVSTDDSGHGASEGCFELANQPKKPCKILGMRKAI